MKVAFLSLWILLGTLPAFADHGDIDHYRGNEHYRGHEHRGAPAPLLGLGIPSALAVGSVLFGAKLWRRRRRN
jgi:hypothetical protein